MALTPKPLPTVSNQTGTTQGSVSTSNVIAAAISAGYITQDRVNQIVARAIAALRAGE